VPLTRSMNTVSEEVRVLYYSTPVVSSTLLPSSCIEMLLTGFKYEI
jgi:hypothetical protein